MGRPKGSSPRPGHAKSGPKPGKAKAERHFKKMSARAIVKAKKHILKLFDDSTVQTLSGAARLLGISPLQVHAWAAEDGDWRELLTHGDAIIADKLEEELINSKNDKAKFFLLKGLRPWKYRDNYKLLVTDSRTIELLEELRKLANPPAPEPEKPPEPPKDPKSVNVDGEIRLLNAISSKSKKKNAKPNTKKLPVQET